MTGHGSSGSSIGRDHDGETLILVPLGDWTLDRAAVLDREAEAVRPDHDGEPVAILLDRVEGLDTVGALLLRRLVKRLTTAGHDVSVLQVQDRHLSLLDAVARADEVQRVPRIPRRPFRALLARTGRAAIGIGIATAELLGFFGLVCLRAARAVIDPRRVRLTATAAHIESAGLDAMPILGLLSFLIGLVIAFQGAEQLRQFGAEIFVVNLLSISVLRELGILLTAIIVAGRSGSAFTAQIGAMSVNQETDAMRTIGLDPVEFLVLPRLLALVVSMPLLAFYANTMALLGGAVTCWFVLDIGFGPFLRQLQAVAEPTHLFVGLIKAPIFAVAIGLVGCYQGLKVTGSAASVGRATTRSVVEGIFLVIALDAVFAVLFQLIGL